MLKAAWSAGEAASFKQCPGREWVLNRKFGEKKEIGGSQCRDGGGGVVRKRSAVAVRQMNKIDGPNPQVVS
jgi:hypothetical protein